ncbi:MAG TPA: tetratricopeptide repeat protein, partial [Pyrinomonadaceae bacterium]|nr:tetratricopeptide repeat protein [Pyrinomonadaceae bacterium]
MYKSVLILAVLALFGSYPNHLEAQVKGDKGQTQTNITSPNTPINSGTTIISAPGPGNAEAEELYKAGIKLTDAGQFSEAVENLQQALRLNPQYADAYAALGRAYFKMREWQKAAVNLRHAMELNKRLKAHANLAAVKTGITSSATTRPRRIENSAAPKSTAANRNIKLPQQTSLNAAAVKPSRPELEATRQPKQLEKVRAPDPSSNATTQINLPQRISNDAAALRFPIPKFKTTLQHNQLEKISVLEPDTFTATKIELPQQTLGADAAAVVRFPTREFKTTLHLIKVEKVRVLAPAIARAPEINLPQPTGNDAGAVRFPTPEFKATLQPNQLEKINALALDAVTTSEIKLPQQTNKNVAVAKPQSSELEARRQEVATAAPSSNTAPQIKLSQEIKGDAAEVKPLSPALESTRKSEKQEEVITPAPATTTTALKLPEVSNADGVKPSSPESQTSRQPAQIADDATVLKSGNDKALKQEQKPEAAQVSMTSTPLSSPVETKNVIPRSSKTSHDTS